MQIIGLLGRKHVGKDVAANYLVNKYQYQKVSLARPLKEGCRILFNLSWSQVYGQEKDILDWRYQCTPREILNLIGTETIRKQFGADFWIDNALNFKLNQKIVISDLRFENEIVKLHNQGGLVIKITRDKLEQDAAEDHIDQIKIHDILLENNSSLLQLNQKLDHIIELHNLD